MNTNWHLRLFEYPEGRIELTFVRPGGDPLIGSHLGWYTTGGEAAAAAVKWARDRGFRLTAPGIDAAQRAHLGGGIMSLNLIPVPLVDTPHTL